MCIRDSSQRTECPVEQPEVYFKEDELSQPPLPCGPVHSSTSPTANPSKRGLRPLPPRSKKLPAVRTAPISTTAARSAKLEPAAGNPAVASSAPSPLDTPHGMQQHTRMVCASLQELLTTWPYRIWCPVPSVEQVSALLHALAAVSGNYLPAHGSDARTLAQRGALAAQEAAAKCGLSDEALIYILSTLVAPGCQQVSHELIWNGDARFRACAMRLPVPNFSLAGSSTANCWALPLPHIEAAMQDTSTSGPSAIDGTRTVDPGAMYMEPPPSGFSDVEHPDLSLIHI